MGPQVATVPITRDGDADRLLAAEPLALLIGTLLNQQMPMERAFRAPLQLKERLGGSLDAQALAAADPDGLAAIFGAPPPLHRAAAVMAARTQALCQYLVEHYDADAGAVWRGAATASDLLARIQDLPGFDVHRAQLLVVLLAEHLDVTPPGWEAAVAARTEREWFSVAPKPRRVVNR